MSRFALSPSKPLYTEADVIQRCRAILERRGYWLQRNPVGLYQCVSDKSWAKFGPEGIPDYTAIHAKYPAFFVEFKRPGKLLREAQQTKFGEIQFGYGLAAVMVDSPEMLVDFLNGHELRAH